VPELLIEQQKKSTDRNILSLSLSLCLSLSVSLSLPLSLSRCMFITINSGSIIFYLYI